MPPRSERNQGPKSVCAATSTAGPRKRRCRTASTSDAGRRPLSSLTGIHTATKGLSRNSVSSTSVCVAFRRAHCRNFSVVPNVAYPVCRASKQTPTGSHRLRHSLFRWKDGLAELGQTRCHIIGKYLLLFSDRKHHASSKLRFSTCHRQCQLDRISHVYDRRLYINRLPTPEAYKSGQPILKNIHGATFYSPLKMKSWIAFALALATGAAAHCELSFQSGTHDV